ncbi:hypothetical protein E2C01_078480 [Portunus trituberculatus]|uniref:Uncharacterized protein n=1 Tax=Portunus trituberculatus TaxID=210409 RepID=A0A5B7IU90_PORTR|nr:hypothetical protein [Portunus trituberculatus]
MDGMILTMVEEENLCQLTMKMVVP